MAREYAQLRIDLFNDTKFRDLTSGAQRLYMVLLAARSLTYAGVGDWRPNRLAYLAKDSTADTIEADAAELIAGHYIVIDAGTEEVLVRSFIKWDGIIKQPRLAVSMSNAYREVLSERLRGVIAYELTKLKRANPDLPVWGQEGLQYILAQPTVNVKETEPKNPENQGLFGPNVTLTLAPGLGQTHLKPPTVTLTTTTTSNLTTSQLRNDVEGICNLLADLIESNGSLRPTIGKNWRDAARLMIDKDHRDPEKIANLIRWAQADSFEQSVVLSMSKFRERYDSLRLKATQEFQRRSAPTRAVTSAAAALDLAARQRAAHENDNRLAISS